MKKDIEQLREEYKHLFKNLGIKTLVGLIFGSLQAITGAFVFMLMIGVVHHNLSDSVNTISYFDSAFLVVLAELLLLTLRFSVDYRDATTDKI